MNQPVLGDSEPNCDSSDKRRLDVATQNKQSLLVIFIHGFKGTDETFGDFPQRVQHVLADSLPDFFVESIVFPAYETKGTLDEAVVRLADWLTTLTVEREVAAEGGAGSVQIALCGHSMGGLLAADSLREFVYSRPDNKAPLWPRIVACLAFDTPYLGLHPSVFKNTITKATEYVGAAKTVGSALLGSLAGYSAKKSTQTADHGASGSSGWQRWTAPAAYAVGGAILAGAATGSAYYKREDLGQGYTWAADHMKYVGNLWDEDALKIRMRSLLEINDDQGTFFRNFYTVLPPSAPAFLTSRSFIVLPKPASPEFSYFLPAYNKLAHDEVQAHTGMFSARTNDGYYNLGLATAQLIQKQVMGGNKIQSEASTRQCLRD
ncbi:hypothetical protein BDQ17DRAFT_1423440 [Cyathus striatus]|nr:hypothetical protein BDQ17DRAFT_1423440 [Cyathus striatus]